MNSRLIFWRNIKHKKLRTLLTLLTIMFSVAMILAVVSTVETTKKAVPQFVETENEQLSFRVLGENDLFSEGTSKQLRKIADIQLLSSLRYPAKMDITTEQQPRVILTGYDDLSSKLLDYELLSGNLADKGLVLSEAEAALLGKKVGDSVKLIINQKNQTIPIIAIVQAHRKLQEPQDWSSLWNISISLETLQSILKQQDKVNLIEIRAKEGSDLSLLQTQIEASLQKEGQTYLQPVFMNLEQTLEGLQEMFLGLYLVGILCLLVCLFILFNSFYVTIQERKKEFAILKTVGFTPHTIIIRVLKEIALLAFISTLPGIGLGILITQALQGLLFGSYSLYTKAEFSFQNGIVIAVICGIGVPILAAWIPVYRTTRISIVSGLNNVVTEIKAKGLLLALIGTLLMSLGIIAMTAKLSLPISFIPIFIGFVIVSPYLLSGTLWLLTPINALFLGNEGVIASRNIARQITRVGITSAILSLGICLIVVVNSFELSILDSQEDLIRNTVGSDIALELAAPLTLKDMDQLTALKGVQTAMFLKQTSASWNEGDKKGNIQVIGINPAKAKDFKMMKPINQTYAELLNPLSNPHSIILAAQAFKQWGGKIGDSIELGTSKGKKQLTVVGMAEAVLNNGYIAYTSDEVFIETFGIQYAKVAFINVAANTETEAVKAGIVQLYDEKIESINTLDDIVRQGRSFIAGTFTIISTLLSLGVLIAAIGIVNTLLINVIDKMKEFAMLRAIGYTKWQVRKMIFGEGLIIGTSGILFGITLGVGISLLFALAGNEMLSFQLHFIVPWRTIVKAAMFGVAVSLLASLLPASKATKAKEFSNVF